MSTLSSPGVGSGLDVRGIVTGLVQSERVPFETRVNKEEEKATEKITALGRLVSATSAFEDAAKKLNDPALFEVNKISGSSEYFSSSVTSKAQTGSYSVEVKSLAQGQKLASKAFASDAKVGTGTMTIGVNGKSMSLTLDGSETISQLKDKINSAEGNPGLVATIITDDQGQRLVLNSKDVGVDNAISITVDDSDGNDTDTAGLSALVFTPDTRDTTGATSQTGSFDATSDLVGDGTLTIGVGGTTFDTATNGLTLEQLKDKINTDAATAGVSVTASLVTDKDGKHQLKLDAGAGNKVTITAADSDGNNTDSTGISQFVFNPDTDAAKKGSVTASGVSNMTETQAATDAQIVIDGSLTVTKSSNEFKDAIEGVTFTVSKVNKPGEKTTVTVAQDTSKVGTALADFAAAYNTFLETTASLGRVNTDSNIVGALVGDSLMRGLVSQVRNVISTTINADGAVNSLASLGLTTNREGLLQVNESLLASRTKENFSDVKKLFTGDDSMGKRLTATLSDYTGGTGSIQAKIDGYKKTIDRIKDDKAEFETKMTSLEERLYKQFNAMDQQVARLNSTGSFLTSQLANLPGVVRNNNSSRR